MKSFLHRIGGLRGEALIAEAYRRHPYFAIRSELVSRFLKDDLPARKAVEAARPPRGKAGVCTIGYEGKSLESYLNCLLRDGVSVLCDVRRNPLSRKYGFSKGTLSKACDGVGIRYEHLSQLGIVSENRRELNTQKDYDELFALYERESLPQQTALLEKIRSWVKVGERVALTCYEHLPEQCHRHCVAEALEKEFGAKFSPKHL